MSIISESENIATMTANHYERILREREEARAENDILRLEAQREAEHHDWMVGELEKVYKERDEAREDAAQLADRLSGLELRTTEELARLERERDEARDDLRQWQTLCLWGGTPEHVHDFIRGQQARIHEAQRIEKTCEQLERERDEARELLASEKITRDHVIKCGIEMQKKRDEARAERDILKLNAQREAEHHDRMVGEIEKVYKERDEAREELNRYKRQWEESRSENVEDTK
jgi:hypothetical protein